MRMVRLAACLAAGALVCVAAHVSADDAAPAPTPKSLDDQIKDISAKLVDINALVATTYSYGFNHPFNNTLTQMVINRPNDSISLYDAWLQFGRNRDDEDFGFTVSMDMGQTAQVTSSDWDGSGTIGNVSSETTSFQVREAYGTYKLPWGGVKLKVGKFVTLMGYEVLMTNTAFNPNISNSVDFGYGINFTETGFLFDAPLGDIVTVDFGLVNGWDNVVDNNHGKTMAIGIGVKPNAMFNTYLTGMYGQEQDGQFAANCPNLPAPCPGAGSKRGTVTWNATLTPIDNLNFILDSVYGNESNLLPDATGALTQSASWYGLTGYVTYAPNMDPVPGLSFALRAEVFDDVNGSRLGGAFNPVSGTFVGYTANPAVSGTPQTVEEFTPTIAYQFNPHILARFEYRYDHSDKLAYQLNSANSFTKVANSITGQFLVAF